jgi:cytosine/adenosine deaminase-related metal-dependent hydrolase
MAGALPPPKSFLDWIEGIIALKAGWSYTDFAQSWLHGARQLIDHGCTTVGDIEAVPELLPEVWEATPMRVVSFLELISVRRRQRPATLIRQALQRLRALPAGRSFGALSPHALYTTNPELLKLVRRTARQVARPITMHVAESAPEFEMFRHGRGAMFNWLRSRSPVQQLAALKLLGPQFLAVHVNYLAPGDAGLLGNAGTSVVHCPRSHAFFGHQAFPFAELRAAGVNVCLGTDSLASIGKEGRRLPELDLFAELRRFAANHPDQSPVELIDLVTRNAAAALGLRGKVGQLSRRSCADLIAVQSTAALPEAVNALVQSPPKIAGVMIAGQWVNEPAG